MKVYKYGCLPPTTNAELVISQMKKGLIYQNKLIEIERWRRDELRKVIIQLGGEELLALEKEYLAKDLIYQQIDKSIKGLHQEKRNKDTPSDLLDAKSAAKEDKKKILDKIIEERSRIMKTDSFSTQKSEIRRASLDKIKEIRKNKTYTPWYGTYMLIEKAMESTKTMKLYDYLEPKNPTFKRFNGEGRIGIQQFRPNLPINKLFDNSCPVIKMFPAEDLGKKSSKDFQIFRMKIDSNRKNNKSEPIYADFPFIYHRPIPSGSEIATVEITKKLIGPREKWSLCITVKEPATTVTTSSESVAIDLGWRQYDDRLVIGTCLDTLNNSFEICVPNNLALKLKKVRELASIRDQEFNQMKEQLILWLTENNLPDWLNQELKHISQWKSKRRFVGLIKRWEINRFSGDEEIMGVSGSWNKKDKSITNGTGLLGWKYHEFHLWNWETSQSSKSRNELTELYRVYATKLASLYGKIIFEDLSGNNMAQGKVAGSNRQLISPFLFREICKMIFIGRGLTFGTVSAKGTSLICNHCGHKNEKTADLNFICGGCNAEIHRDHNAVKNILSRYQLPAKEVKTIIKVKPKKSKKK